MNDLVLLLKAAQDYYKTNQCGVFIRYDKGRYYGDVKDDSGVLACKAEHSDLGTLVRDLAAQWLAFVSPTRALIELAKAVPPSAADADRKTS